MRKEPVNNSKSMCELCSKKASIVIREYGIGKWLCYECYSRKETSKGQEKTLLKSNNKNV